MISTVLTLYQMGKLGLGLPFFLRQDKICKMSSLGKAITARQPDQSFSGEEWITRDHPSG
jgi:hypothetical protein